MDCPYLKVIVALIKEYSEYRSNALIAERIGISERTLRGYWDLGNVEVPSIPSRNEDAFCNLVMEIIPRPLSYDSAKQLLQGSGVLFHNALLPIGGGLWRNLIEHYSSDSNIEVLLKTDCSFAFGESDDEDAIIPDAIVSFRQSFYFSGRTPWRGEAVIVAEHLGQWHICSVAQEQRIAPLEGNPFFMPPKPVALKEQGKEGIYRYFIIGVKGKFSELLREQLHRANPPQPDVLADLFMAHGKGSCIVWGTTIQIKKNNENNY